VPTWQARHNNFQRMTEYETNLSIGITVSDQGQSDDYPPLSASILKSEMDSSSTMKENINDSSVMEETVNNSTNPEQTTEPLSNTEKSRENPPGTENEFWGQGIIIEPDDKPGPESSTLVHLVTVNDIKNIPIRLHWCKIELSHLLGFPLLFGVVHNSGNSLPNSAIVKLSIILDPESPKFGQSALPSTYPAGRVVIIREDRQSVYTAHVHALLQFVDFGLKDIRSVGRREEAGEVVDRKELAARLLSKDVFRRFFEQMKKAMEEQEVEIWEGVPCPV
jgi:hypothetical protein